MNTETAVLVVDPKIFGLEESKANEMVGGLTPTLMERQMLTEQYESVIKMELGKPAYKAASELRKRIKENRTKGIEVWHKTNKEFYLRGGQFVDAIKTKEIAVNQQMESRLEEIEKHEAIVEAQRIAALQKEREGQLLVYEVENVERLALGTMDELVWNNFLSGTKSSFEARKEAEKAAEQARIENERLDGIEKARTLEVARYTKFITDKFDLRNGSDSDYQIYLAKLVAAEIEHDQEQARLKAEADEIRKKNEEAEAQAEADKKAKEEKAQKFAERLIENGYVNLGPAKFGKSSGENAIPFTVSFEALLSLSEDEFISRMKEVDDKISAEIESKKQLEIESKKAQEAEAELKRKQDEEAKAEAERKAEEQRLAKEAAKLAKAPVKKQLNVWIDSITTEIPTTIADDETAKLILQKFEAFKSWAKSQVDSI